MRAWICSSLVLFLACGGTTDTGDGGPGDEGGPDVTVGPDAGPGDDGGTPDANDTDASDGGTTTEAGPFDPSDARHEPRLVARGRQGRDADEQRRVRVGRPDELPQRREWRQRQRRAPADDQRDRDQRPARGRVRDPDAAGSTIAVPDHPGQRVAPARRRRLRDLHGSENTRMLDPGQRRVAGPLLLQGRRQQQSDGPGAPRQLRQRHEQRARVARPRAPHRDRQRQQRGHRLQRRHVPPHRHAPATQTGARGLGGRRRHLVHAGRRSAGRRQRDRLGRLHRRGAQRQLRLVPPRGRHRRGDRRQGDDRRRLRDEPRWPMATPKPGNACTPSTCSRR